MSEENREEVVEYWQCKCCNIKVDDKSDRKVLPIVMGGDPNIPESNITFFICPNCYTVQMPEQMFEELHKRINSNIIY